LPTLTASLSGVTPIHDRQDIPAEYAELNSALDTKMGFELLLLKPEIVVGRMPVAGNTQPYGLWHGGASCVLAETLASLGSFMHAQPDRISVGVDINATHHRSVTAGWVTGTATALRLGRSVASYEIVITNDADERICTARVTCQLVTPRAR
jgi:1,4-dihydroxy-2-naphthoyl-CoA hydrolase